MMIVVGTLCVTKPQFQFCATWHFETVQECAVTLMTREGKQDILVGVEGLERFKYEWTEGRIAMMTSKRVECQ